jgi:16S rRNA (uracil1498-N3)-methyltransferase
MARRLFFVPEVRRGTAEVTGPDAEHLVRVLRAEAGQIYEISDNRQRYLAKIETARKSGVVFEIVEPLPPTREIASVHLYPALFKFDRLEWMIEKATELGVTTIRPFEAARTERGLREAASKRIVRWERIALEASQQSRRTKLPELYRAVSLDSAVRSDFSIRLLLDEAETASALLAVIEECCLARSSSDRIAVMLGPEGGWADTERQAIVAAGWKPCSLGSTILRAETAALAGLSVINALWDR